MKAYNYWNFSGNVKVYDIILSIVLKMNLIKKQILLKTSFIEILRKFRRLDEEL